MKVVAVIPARGGSKGIPRKNIAYICGHPLIFYTINSALKTKYVNRVIVSTDDYEIADIARKCGAEVIIRPEEISGDTASSESAVIHVIEQLKEKENYQPDIVLLLQCTSPLTSVEEIDGCVSSLLEDRSADSAFAACPFFYFLWKSDNNNFAVGINHDGGYRKRRQDLETQYLESGSVYAMRTEKFLETQNRFCGKTVIYKMDDTSSNLEIDEPIDLLKAETAVRYYLDKKKSQLIPSDIKSLIIDFEGVITNNKVLLDNNGNKIFELNNSDIVGLNMLANIKIPLLIITNEYFPNLEQLFKDNNISYKYGYNRLSIINTWLKENNISSGIWYAANDIDSIECLKRVDFSVVPYNADEEIKKYAGLILEKSGGNGAIRELAELIIKKMNSDLSAIDYTQGLRDIRPWGRWEVITVGLNYVVKRIYVKPKGILSLQSHNHRAETWHIISGEGEVQINDSLKVVQQGDIVKIAIGDKHRIKNTSESKTLIFIEVQEGDILDENDIVRYSDVYDRI